MFVPATLSILWPDPSCRRHETKVNRNSLQKCPKMHVFEIYSFISFISHPYNLTELCQQEGKETWICRKKKSIVSSYLESRFSIPFFFSSIPDHIHFNFQFQVPAPETRNKFNSAAKTTGKPLVSKGKRLHHRETNIIQTFPSRYMSLHLLTIFKLEN